MFYSDAVITPLANRLDKELIIIDIVTFNDFVNNIYVDMYTGNYKDISTATEVFKLILAALLDLFHASCGCLTLYIVYLSQNLVGPNCILPKTTFTIFSADL